MGVLTDAEYAEQETELLERLNSIRDYWNELLEPDPAEYDEYDEYEEYEEYETDEDHDAYDGNEQDQETW